MREEFIKEFKELLSKYGADISADDYWRGYSECGQDIQMIVEFDNHDIEDINLGNYMHSTKELK